MSKHVSLGVERAAFHVTMRSDGRYHIETW
jgi:hypothetical protein